MQAALKLISGKILPKATLDDVFGPESLFNDKRPREILSFPGTAIANALFPARGHDKRKKKPQQKNGR